MRRLLLVCSVAVATAVTVVGVVGNADEFDDRALTPYREFIDRSGRPMTGRVLRISENRVTMQRESDKRTFVVPITTFSAADQEFIRSLATPEAKPTPAQEAATRVFAGTWQNQRRGTSGELRCTARPGENGRWEARFEGTFRGDTFRYEIVMNSQQQGNRLNLTGQARIDGDPYEWQGNITGPTLVGEFRSQTGNYGAFTLQESRR